MEFSEVYEVAVKYMAKVFRRNDELASIALVLVWWLWRNRRKDFAPGVYCRMAMRHALAGRDLPGVKGTGRDLWDHLARIGGAGDGVKDRTPGPDQLAASREEYHRLLTRLNRQEARMAEAVGEEGLGTKALAHRLGVSATRVSQMRREIAAKCE